MDPGHQSSSPPLRSHDPSRPPPPLQHPHPRLREQTLRQIPAEQRAGPAYPGQPGVQHRAAQTDQERHQEEPGQSEAGHLHGERAAESRQAHLRHLQGGALTASQESLRLRVGGERVNPILCLGWLRGERRGEEILEIRHEH